MRTITGAQAVVESLIAEGVEVVFGYPGGAVLPLYDVLYSSPLRHILTRHEQGQFTRQMVMPGQLAKLGFASLPQDQELPTW